MAKEATKAGQEPQDSVYTRAILGDRSRTTLRHDSEGETMQVRIVRACGEWVEGDTLEINAEYASQLIGSGLAECMCNEV